MKIKPIHDRVIVSRREADSRTRGGLHIPDNAKEQSARGVVIAAGPGKLKDTGEIVPMQVKAGDEVIFGKYAGSEIKLDGEDHVVLREDEILAVICGSGN